MNKKTVIIINIFVLLLLIIGGIIFWEYSQKTPTINTTTTNKNPFTQGQNTTNIIIPTENSTSTAQNTSNTIDIKTNNGGYLKVVDFYQSPYTRIIDKQNDAVIKEGINYNVLFYAKDQSFNITLNGGDLYSVRTEAENEFLKKLGISKEEACQLPVSLGVPFFANEKASGGEYGLSFCPNGKPLPKNLNEPNY